MKQSKTFRNEIIFTPENVITSEIGITITSKFKRWNEPNLNGFVFTPDSYDKCINEYFTKGGKNIPLTLMHGKGFNDIVGKVTSLDKDSEGLTMTAVVFKEYPEYEWVKTLISERVLQGISDDGYIIKSEQRDDNTELITECFLCNISLVTIPAETAANVEIANTAFKGFAPTKRRLFKKNNH